MTTIEELVEQTAYTLRRRMTDGLAQIEDEVAAGRLSADDIVPAVLALGRSVYGDDIVTAALKRHDGTSS